MTVEDKAENRRNELRQRFRKVVQAHLDAKAQTRDYDNSFTLASYVTSTIPAWSTEAQAFVAWRDSVWTYALDELEKAVNGEREIPTAEDFIAELPAFEFPE